jgi:hypothetical protein
MNSLTRSIAKETKEDKMNELDVDDVVNELLKKWLNE